MHYKSRDGVFHTMSRRSHIHIRNQTVLTFATFFDIHIFLCSALKFVKIPRASVNLNGRGRSNEEPEDNDPSYEKQPPIQSRTRPQQSPRVQRRTSTIRDTPASPRIDRKSLQAAAARGNGNRAKVSNQY
jgi:hypothetical protein